MNETTWLLPLIILLPCVVLGYASEISTVAYYLLRLFHGHCVNDFQRGAVGFLVLDVVSKATRFDGNHTASLFDYLGFGH